MAKMRTKALRQLHADLGKILEDYDASCATAADGPADPHARNRAPNTGSLVETPDQAHDSAFQDGISMTEAFPGWTANGPLSR